MRFVVVAFALLLFAGSAAGQSIDGTIWVSGVRSTGDNRIVDAPVPVDLVLSSGPGFAGSVDFGVAERWGLQVHASRLRPDVSLFGGGLRLNLGSLSMTTFSVAILHTRVVRNVRLWGGGGGTYARFDTIDAPVVRQFTGEGLSIDPAAGFVLVGGAGIPITPRLSIAGEVRYLPVESALEASDFPVDIDLNPITFSAGLRYRFR